MKIAITGGHITPALAVIDELLKNKDNKIVYFGRKYSFEGDKTLSNDQKIISKIKNIKYINLETGRFQRRLTKQTIPSLLKIPRGFFQARKELKKEKPEIVLSFGGYLAVPVVVAAYLQRIPIITHEQTVVIGLANRIISFFTDRILVSWEESLKHFPEGKTKLIGNPIRKDIFRASQASFRYLPERLRKIIKKKAKNPNLKVLYVTGGNQGSKIINQVIWNLLPELLEDYLVIHQCGTLDWENFSEGKLVLDDSKKENYFISPWIETEKMGWVLNAADLVISRAGANTVYELGALGKPVIFIPIPWVVNNEQQKNAEILSDAGFAKILSQNDLKELKLKKMIEEMFEGMDVYIEKGQNFKDSLLLDSASGILGEIEELISKKIQ